MRSISERLARFSPGTSRALHPEDQAAAEATHPADPLASGWALIRRSSRASGWTDLQIELRSSPAAERPEIAFDLPHLLLWEATARGEVVAPGGQYVQYRKEAGTLNFLTPGALGAIRTANVHRAIFCTFQPQFLDELESEMEVRPAGSMSDNHGFVDAALRDLVRLLAQEAAEGAPHGKLYADSLKNAIATRVLLLDRSVVRKTRGPSSLPPHLLRRSVDFMVANLGQDIEIGSIASQTGYSRSQFLKLFTAATGVPPHRYLVNLRLERARSLLSSNKFALIDIAAACGFSSQSHLTTTFRRHFGTAPARFARSQHNAMSD